MLNFGKVSKRCFPMLLTQCKCGKPYKKRVEGTYELMKSMIEIVEEDQSTITSLRNKTINNLKEGVAYPLNWVIDSTKTRKPVSYPGGLQPVRKCLLHECLSG